MRLIEEKSVMIFRKDGVTDLGKNYTFYSIGVSSKNQNGGYNKAYLPCKFKKGVEIKDRTKIKIDNAFPTVETYKDNCSIRWMITDFAVVEEPETGAGTQSFIDIPDSAIDELPFA